MSRLPRSGEAGKQRSFRATDTEWSAWERAAKAEDCATLSAWIVRTLNARATRAGSVPSAPHRHKRCPRCNQRLLVVDGQIEPHMEPPSPRGGTPRQCAGAAQPR